MKFSSLPVATAAAAAALFIWGGVVGVPAQKTFHSQKFLLTNKAHNASYTQGDSREAERQRGRGSVCGTEDVKNMGKVSIIISNSTTNSKNQIWELVRNIVHTPCSMQLTLATLFPFPPPLAYPVQSIEKFAAALANRQNGIRISGRTHKKAMWQARRWRRSRVRDMEKLLWFYWNQSMGVAYSPSLCLDRPPLPANNMK